MLVSNSLGLSSKIDLLKYAYLTHVNLIDKSKCFHLFLHVSKRCQVLLKLIKNKYYLN